MMFDDGKQDLAHTKLIKESKSLIMCSGHIRLWESDDRQLITR